METNECECVYCEHCSEREEECMCETCDECGEKIDDCECEELEPYICRECEADLREAGVIRRVTWQMPFNEQTNSFEEGSFVDVFDEFGSHFCGSCECCLDDYDEVSTWVFAH